MVREAVQTNQSVLFGNGSPSPSVELFVKNIHDCRYWGWEIFTHAAEGSSLPLLLGTPWAWVKSFNQMCLKCYFYASLLKSLNLYPLIQNET